MEKHYEKTKEEDKISFPLWGAHESGEDYQKDLDEYYSAQKLE